MILASVGNNHTHPYPFLKKIFRHLKTISYTSQCTVTQSSRHQILLPDPLKPRRALSSRWEQQFPLVSFWYVFCPGISWRTSCPCPPSDNRRLRQIHRARWCDEHWNRDHYFRLKCMRMMYINATWTPPGSSPTTTQILSRSVSVRSIPMGKPIKNLSY